MYVSQYFKRAKMELNQVSTTTQYETNTTHVPKTKGTRINPLKYSLVP